MARLLLVPVLILVLAGNAAAQDYWASLDGPAGGNVSFIMQTASGTTLALADNGVYRATTGDWERADGPPVAASFLAAAQTSSGVLIAGTANSGVWRSTDDGRSWSTSSDGLASTFYDGVATRPGTNEVLVSGGFGVFRSTDAGLTWDTTSVKWLTTSLTVDSAGYVYAATDRGVMRATDGVWTRVDTLSGGLPKLLAVASDGALWGAVANAGVLRSTNHGERWDSIAGLPRCCPAMLRQTSPGEMAVSFGRGGAALTRDNGATWQPVVDTNSTLIIQSLARAEDSVLLVGTIKGVFAVFTTPGRPWEFVSDGIINSPVRAMVAEGGPEPALYVLQYNGLFALGGNVPEKGVVDPQPMRLSTAFALTRDSGGTFLIAHRAGPLLKSTNGLEWTSVAQKPFDVNTLASSSTAIYAGSWAYTGAVARSVDGGATWTSTSLDSGSNSVVALVTRGDTVWAGTETGLYRSTDAGASFAPVGPSIRSYCIALSPSGTVYVGSYVGRVYRSTDGGTTWTYSTAVATAPLIAAIGVNSRGHVFAGAQPGGIAISTDGGTTWTPRNDGLSNPAVTAIVFDAEDYAYVGTFGAGVFRSTARTAAAPHGPDGAAELRLSTTAEAVTLHARIDAPADAVVDLIDLRGVRVARERRMLSASDPRVTVSTADLPAGVYVARAVVAGRTVVMLVRR